MFCFFFEDGRLGFFMLYFDLLINFSVLLLRIFDIGILLNFWSFLIVFLNVDEFGLFVLVLFDFFKMLK